MFYRIPIVLFLMFSALHGCSGMQMYQDRPVKNVEVVIEKGEDGLLNSVDVGVGVMRVDKDCNTDYLGTVDTRESRFKLGLDVGKLSYINFVFYSSGMFSNDSTLSFGSLIKPRQGYNYLVKASYMEGIYNLEIYEKRKGMKTRQLETLHYRECKAL